MLLKLTHELTRRNVQKARRLSEGFQAFTRSNSQPVISVNDVQEQPFESDDDWPDIDCQVATNGVSIASGCIYSAWDRLSDGRCAPFHIMSLLLY